MDSNQQEPPQAVQPPPPPPPQQTPSHQAPPQQRERRGSFGGGGKFSRNNNNNNFNKNNRNETPLPFLASYHYPIEALLELGDDNWLLNHSTVSQNAPPLIDTAAKTYLRPFYANHLNWIPNTACQDATTGIYNDISELIDYPFLQFLPNFTPSFPQDDDHPHQNHTTAPPLVPKQPAILSNDVINAVTVQEYVKRLAFPRTHDPTSPQYLGTSTPLPPLYLPKVTIIFDPTLDLGSLPITAGQLDKVYRTVAIEKSPSDLLVPIVPAGQNESSTAEPTNTTNPGDANNPTEINTIKGSDSSEQNLIGAETEKKDKFAYWSVLTRKNTSKPFFDHADQVSVLIPKITSSDESTVNNTLTGENDGDGGLRMPLSKKPIATPQGLTLKHFLHFYLNYNYSLFPLPIVPNNLTQPPMPMNRFPFEFNYVPPLMSIKYPQVIPGRTPHPGQEKLNFNEATRSGASQRVLYDLHFSCSLSHGTVQAVTPNLNNVLNKIQIQLKQRENDQRRAVGAVEDKEGNNSQEGNKEPVLITAAAFNQTPMQPNFLSRCLYNQCHFDGILFDINQSNGEIGAAAKPKFLSINSRYHSNIHLHPQHIVPLNINEFQIPTLLSKPTKQSEPLSSSSSPSLDEEWARLTEWQKDSPQLITPAPFFEYEPFNTTALLVDITDNVTPLQREAISLPVTNGSNMGRLPLVHHIESDLKLGEELNDIDHTNYGEEPRNEHHTFPSRIATLPIAKRCKNGDEATSVSPQRSTIDNAESCSENTTTTTTTGGNHTSDDIVQLGSPDSVLPPLTEQLVLIPTTPPTVENCIPGIIDVESRRLLEGSNAVSSSPKAPELQIIADCFNHAFFPLNHNDTLEQSRKQPSIQRQIIDMYCKASKEGSLDGFVVEKGYDSEPQDLQKRDHIVNSLQSIPFNATDPLDNRCYQVNYQEHYETATARHDSRVIKPHDLLAKHFPHSNPTNPTNPTTASNPNSVKIQSVATNNTNDTNPATFPTKTFKPFAPTSNEITTHSATGVDYTHGDLDTTIHNTLFSHTISCLNHSYTPVNFNSKPIVGICVVMRGCSGSGKSTLTGNLFSRRHQGENDDPSTFQTDSNEQYTQFEQDLLLQLHKMELESTSQIKAFIQHQTDSTQNSIDTHLVAETYVTGSDNWYDVPTTQTLLSAAGSDGRSLSTKPSCSNGTNPLQHESVSYCWDPTVLGLTHYLCQAKALNAMTFYWSRFLFRLSYLSASFSKHSAQYGSPFPALNRIIHLAQSQRVEQLPILLIDNTSLNAKSVSNYFTACLANGFIMVNLEPTTPWGATNYLLIKKQLQEYTNRKAMQKPLAVKDDREVAGAKEEPTDAVKLDDMKPSPIPTQKQFLSQFNLDPSIITQRGHSDDEIDSTQLELGARLEGIMHELFQRNTHGVPFVGIKSMLTAFTDINDVYDLIIF